MEAKIILTVVIVLGIIIAFCFRGILHKILAGGQAIAILCMWTGFGPALSTGLLLLFITGFLTFMYGFNKKAWDMFQNIGIMLTGILFMLSMVAKILHLPGGGYFKLIWILPVILVLISAIKDKRVYTKEMSFMLFWCTYGVMQFIAIWT